MPEKLVAKKSEVSEGSWKDFQFKGKPAILLNGGGDFRAYVNVCTHEGGQCIMQDGVLWCTLHGSTFDPKTGHALSGPAALDSYLTAIKLQLRGEDIYVIE
jgi:nitrite reductase/ring-hydroxylating ferredoxin subunit